MFNFQVEKQEGNIEYRTPNIEFRRGLRICELFDGPRIVMICYDKNDFVHHDNHNNHDNPRSIGAGICPFFVGVKSN
jgi:hypothetical protein